jgi:subtilisin family serine protease
MKKKKNLGVSAVLVFLSLCFMLLICNENAWAQNKKLFVEDELLIQFRIDTPKNKADEALNAHGATVADEIQQLRIKRIKVPAHVLETVREALSHNPHVEFIENNFLAEASTTPNDSYYPSQWHLPKINAPSGWDITSGSESMPIAIIDSGVDPDHPDLVGKLITGYNFLGSNTDTHDVLGHGTAVAGTAAATTNNITGVAGIACDNPIMPLVVLNSSNYASYYDISRAITYAVDHGVRVLNISIGGSSSSSTLQSAVDSAWNKGALIFASAMNNNTSTPYYPAACNHVVAVSATTSTDTKASFSSFGTWVDISAPGASIYTTKDGGGYGYWNGTSFASPLTAGLAALIWSINPLLTNSQVYDILTQNADDLGTLGFDQYFGFGRINSLRSLLAAMDTAPATDTTAPVVSITSPATNTTVCGVISVSISASDNVDVSKVELYINGNSYASDSSSPYPFAWDTTKYANGTYTLRAVAYDSAGNIGQSATVTVNVLNQQDTIAPKASITSPSNGATVGKKVTINATASDNIAVTKLELHIDGVLKSVTNTSSLSYNWNTNTAAKGSHTITAKAYDGAGNSGVHTITVYK